MTPPLTLLMTWNSPSKQSSEQILKQILASISIPLMRTLQPPPDPPEPLKPSPALRLDPKMTPAPKQHLPVTQEPQSLKRKDDHSLSVAWSPPLPSRSRLPVLPDSSSSEQLPISSSASQVNLKRTITSKPFNFHTLNLFNNSLERILNLLLAAPHISPSPQSSSLDPTKDS